jgi:hypothetical protein
MSADKKPDARCHWLKSAPRTSADWLKSFKIAVRPQLLVPGRQIYNRTGTQIYGRSSFNVDQFYGSSIYAKPKICIYYISPLPYGRLLFAFFTAITGMTRALFCSTTLIEI